MGEFFDDCDELSSGLMDYFRFSGSLIEDPLLTINSLKSLSGDMTSAICYLKSLKKRASFRLQQERK